MPRNPSIIAKGIQWSGVGHEVHHSKISFLCVAENFSL